MDYKFLSAALSLVASFIVVTSCRQARLTAPSAEGSPLVRVSLQAALSANSVSLRTHPSWSKEKLLHHDNLFVLTGMRVVFYSVDDQGKAKEVKEVFDLDVRRSNGTLSGTDLMPSSTYTALDLRPLSVPLSDYRVLIIGNPDQVIKERTQKGSSVSELDAPHPVKYEPNGKGYRFYANAFFYTPEWVCIEKSALERGERTFSASLIANHAFVAVNWENASSLKDFTIGVDDLAFYPDVVPRQYNLFPAYTSVALANGEQAQLPLSPAQTLLKFEGKTNELTGTYASRAEIPFLRFPEYVPSSSPISLEDIPRIIVRVKTSPRTDIPIGNSWTMFKGKVYNDSELSALYSSEKDPAAKQILERVLDKAGRISSEAQKGYHDRDIQYYAGGNTYYALPLRHFNRSEVEKPYTFGRFGVVRNVLYLFHITSFDTYGHASAGAIGYATDYEYSSLGAGLVFTAPHTIEHDVRL